MNEIKETKEVSGGMLTCLNGEPWKNYNEVAKDVGRIIDSDNAPLYKGKKVWIESVQTGKYILVTLENADIGFSGFMMYLIKYENNGVVKTFNTGNSFAILHEYIDKSLELKAPMLIKKSQ